MDRMGAVKTTLDIHDELLSRAKHLAKATGRPLRAVVEDGLRRVLAEQGPTPYVLPDLREGDPDGQDPLAHYSWPEICEMMYGGDCH